MSNYKDFTNYNQAAEEIRPTARIQLIQRILNAASIISSLASGVPLRWANAYKSFQVLVPTENGAPTDYTTAEAISSVDSILYESESALRSAHEDMNTLVSEINKFPLDGTIDYKNQMCEINGKKMIVLTPSGKFIALEFDSNSIPEKLHCYSSQQWTDLLPLQKINGTGSFSANQPIVNTLTKLEEFVQNRYTKVPIGFVDTNGFLGFIDVTTYHPLVGNRYSISCTRYDVDGSLMQSWTFVIPDLNSVSIGDDITGTRVYGVESVGSFLNQSIHGLVPASDALGLPDPTDVINELNSLE